VYSGKYSDPPGCPLGVPSFPEFPVEANFDGSTLSPPFGKMKSLQPSNSEVLKIAALVAAHGIAAGALKAQVSDFEFSDELDADEVVVLPNFLVEDEAQRDVSTPKFTQPLVDTPQTITVIPRRLIEEQGATDLRDILRNSPGITFQAGEGGTPAGDQMTIRGFSARTDLFVDGVRDLGGYARDSFNVEQVEVAKGPSSAISGRGSTGGSVNLVTKSPRETAFVRAAIAGGTDDYGRATIDVNQPRAFAASELMRRSV
jgi:catecholate siderophore receptor